MKKISLLILLFAFSNVTLCQHNIGLQAFGPSTFSNPIDIQNAGDSRLFIVERGGLIKILNDNETVNATPFLDIDDRVTNAGGESGLLGLAFHPDYINNGYFYVNYINNSGDTVISRFSRNAVDSNLANASSEFILLTISQPFGNHNGGCIAFGPDGYLYIGMGDGGSGGDPGDRAQDLSTLLGKMLRLDVDTGSPYGIPVGNPYASDGDANTLAEIWAFGLRNPWRFSFDSLANDLWIADVGQNAYEEVNSANYTSAGLNYGWRCYEANAGYNLTGCAPANTMTFPVVEYHHTSSGNFKCSITGGYVYRGSTYPNLFGLYFFADYCSGEIGTAEYDGGNWTSEFTNPFSESWVTFGEDSANELYIGSISGQIYRVIDENLSTNEFSKVTFKMFPNPVDNHVTITPTNTPYNFTIKLLDPQGKLVQEMISTNNTVNFSTKTLPNGIYFVEISLLNGNKSTKKLVVY